MSTEDVPLLEVAGLSKHYRSGGRMLEVLRGVDLTVRRGEILAIVGQSGSGKSTLLHQIGLLDEPDSGTIRFRGEAVSLAGPPAARFRNGHVGFVFQFYHLLPEFSALENVLMPAMILHSWSAWRRNRPTLRARAQGLIDRMGLAERATHRPGQLSGGERQRVAIARALVNRPELLLCDEPTGNLDRETAAEVRDLIWDLNRTDGQTTVLVTHDAELASRADRVLRLDDGILAAA